MTRSPCRDWTAEKAKTVNAPRIAECFLSIECEFLWEREHFEGSLM